MLHYVLGITKAYTRVGGGPFPSELDIETAKSLVIKCRIKQEIGTVTKRKTPSCIPIALRRSARI
jgi:adenylosuccinate synthase